MVKNILSSINEEVKTLSDQFLKEENKETSLRSIQSLWELIGNDNIKNFAYSKQKASIRLRVNKLRYLSEEAVIQLIEVIDKLPQYTKDLKISREIAMEGLPSIEFETNNRLSAYVLEHKLHKYLQKYIKINSLETKFHSPFTLEFMKGVIDQSCEEEFPPYSFYWKKKYNKINTYLEEVKDLQNSQHTKAWYCYEHLHSLINHMKKKREKPRFPISGYNYLFNSISLSDYNNQSLIDYKLDTIKRSWINLYIEIKNPVIPITKVYFHDSDVPSLRTENSSSKGIKKGSDEYKALQLFAEGKESINKDDLPILLEPDLRNEIAKNIRLKTGLSKEQFRNKQGVFRLVNAKIYKE